MTRKTEDTYKEIKVLKYPGCTVRIHIPDLDPKEYARRHKEVNDAAVGVIKELVALEKNQMR